jgi:hypothetical protein
MALSGGKACLLIPFNLASIKKIMLDIKYP